MLPTSTDLHYFLHIAHLGNLTHAAQSLGIAQPSLTLAMQRLEQSLGVELFIRSRKGVKLTKAGEKLLSETRRLLDSWDTLKQQVLQTMGEVRGRFSLGCHASVGHYSLPLFLPALLKKYPHLEIHLQHDLSRHILQKILNLEVDLGIVVNPTPHPDLVLKSLGKDDVTLWRSAQATNEDVLVCDPNLFQTQYIMQRLKKHGFHFERTISSTNLEVIGNLIKSGAGIGILPGRVASTFSPRLKQVKGAPIFSDEIFLAYRTENRNVKALQVLSKSIQAAFA